MKKILFTALILSISSSIFLSCSKSSTTPAQLTTTSGKLGGYWFGTFTIKGSTTPTANEGEFFQSGGSSTVQYDFDGVTSTDTATCPFKAYGNYTLSGDTVNFTTTFPSLSETFNEMAIIDTLVHPNTMSGTFTSISSPGGSFFFTKQ